MKHKRKIHFWQNVWSAIVSRVMGFFIMIWINYRGFYPIFRNWQIFYFLSSLSLDCGLFGGGDFIGLENYLEFYCTRKLPGILLYQKTTWNFTVPENYLEFYCTRKLPGILLYKKTTWNFTVQENYLEFYWTRKLPGILLY